MLRWATLVTIGVAACGGSETRVRLAVPTESLLFLNYYVALGGALFQAEGLDVEIFEPASASATDRALLDGDADAVVLQPPQYLRMVASQDPFVMFANLLTNDSVNLVMRESLRAQLAVSPSAPLSDRVAALRGLRIGVARGPITRLRLMFAAGGFDLDTDATAVEIAGEAQIGEFSTGAIDVLFAHTPYLEEVLIRHGATMLVDVSGGEVATLAGLQLHTLSTMRAFADSQPATVLGLTRAIYRAQQLIHTDPAAAAAAVSSALPELDQELLAAAIEIYAPAIPQTPAVTAEGIAGALSQFPAHMTPPDLTGIDLAAFVAPQFAQQVIADGR